MTALHDKRSIWMRMHLDLPLLIAILLMMAGSITVVYSASGQESAMMIRHMTRMGVAIIAMVVLAQIPPATLKRLTIPMYCVGLLMLVGVLLFGVSSKGAQRWLDLGLTRFQPSELMKLCIHFVSLLAKFLQNISSRWQENAQKPFKNARFEIKFSS